MKKKSEYTIADIIYSRRKPLTTRFYVPPDRERAVKDQFKRLMPLSHAYLIKDLPIHGDMVAFVDAEIRKQYDPVLVKQEVDQALDYFDLDWVKVRIARNSDLEMQEVRANINHHKTRTESFKVSIEDMALEITNWQADLNNLQATASRRIEKAKDLKQQLEEIRKDGVWDVLQVDENCILFANKYPFVLTETSTGNMLQIGYWILKIPLDGRYENIKLIPFSHNVKYDGYCHPNISGPCFPCYGEARNKMHELMQVFRLLDITRYFTTFMTEYTHYQPFITFSTFYELGKVYAPWLINECIGQHEQTYMGCNYREIKQVLENNNQFLAIRAVYMLGIENEVKPENAVYPAHKIYKELYPEDFEFRQPIEEPDQEGMSEDEIENEEPFIGYIERGESA